VVLVVLLVDKVLKVELGHRVSKAQAGVVDQLV